MILLFIWACGFMTMRRLAQAALLSFGSDVRLGFAREIGILISWPAVIICTEIQSFLREKGKHQ